MIALGTSVLKDCRLAALTALCVLCVATTLRANIAGFNSLSGWTSNVADAGAPPVVNGNSVQITDGPDAARSIWYGTPQSITSFTASFTYRASFIANSASRQGMTFAFQRAGPNAVGAGGAGLGYAGISPSAALSIETDTTTGQTLSRYYTNGIVAGEPTPLLGINAFNLSDITVFMSYNGGSLINLFLSQGANSSPPLSVFTGNIAASLGGPTAYVGFTAGTSNTLGSGGGAGQILSNFSYTVPTPAAISLLVLSGMIVGRRNR